MKLTWETLNSLGKSRILRTSYIWLLVVPVAAKVLSSVNSPIKLTGIGEGLRFNLELPFTWKLFYLSSIAISFAGIIYTLKCPLLVRKFNTFNDFKIEGRNLDYLKSYAKILEGYKLANGYNNSVPIDIQERDKPILFWSIRDFENTQFQFWIWLCFCLYAFGLLCIALVLLENFLYVAKSCF